MGHSFLVTAGLILGQAQTAQVVSQPIQGQCGCESSAHQNAWGRQRTWGWQQSSTPNWQYSSSPTSSTWSEERPILSRIQAFFRGDQNQSNWSNGTRVYGGQQPVPVHNEIYSPVHSAPTPPTEFLHRMPSKVSLAEPPLLEGPKSGITTASYETKVTAPTAVAPAAVVPTSAATVSSSPSFQAAPRKMAHEENFAWISGRIAFDNGILVVQYGTAGASDRFGGRLVLTGDHDFSSYKEGEMVTVRGQLIPGQGGMNFYRVNTIERTAQSR